MPEKRIYVDTNVYIDLFENRHDKLVPWGEFAHQLLKRTIDCEFRIIMSALVTQELKDNGYEKQIMELIRDLKKYNKIEDVRIEKNDRQNAAKQKSKSHFSDRLHFVLAQKKQADFFVTRNWKDFYGLGDIQIFTPEFI